MDKRKYMIGLTALIVAFAAGRFFAPAKVETKIVEKVVTRESETKDRDQTVTKKETRLPNGTIIKEERKETTTRIEKQTQKDTQVTNEKKVWSRPDYSVGVIYEPRINGFQTQSIRGTIERRIVGEIYGGLSFSTDGTLGLVLRLGF